ncbi:MAG: hypothetical protein A2Z21_09470 [Candidatus Fraserbacteria bacterium RBG_16_55_9]|uniref:Uncharacterized protein n=1 Tax=Fraserbacteria sp. (strain RBG_16_55_9) TaxID=1817864 RepID=A0A1F5UPY0_FRAXR|nr:MAG: hypothetical protein A2Z21_09470 [Candidatus Fraserbacteria bacterium RBG_16_55_9]
MADQSRQKVRVDLNLAAEFLVVLAVCLLVFWIWGVPIADQLGDCAHKFIEAKNGGVVDALP